MEISKRQLQENYNRSNLDNIFNEIVKTKPNRITLSGYFPRIAGFRSELFEKLNNALQEIFKSNNTESYAKYLKNIILQEMVLRDMIIQNTPNSYRLSQKGNIHGEDYFTKAKRIYGEGKIESILNIIEKNIIEMEKPQDNMFEVTKGQLEEAKKARTKLRKKKKGDRCTRIAKSKYDVWPSAYSSGAVVRCRQGKIWRGLKEEEEDVNFMGGITKGELEEAKKARTKLRKKKKSEFSKFVGSEFGDEEGNIFSVEEVYEFVEANKEKYFKSNFPISKLIHNLEWWDKNYDINNKEHKRRMMNSDTSYPLLVVKEKNNLSVADGLNRLYKAVNIENKKNIDIYLINKEDIMSLNKKSLNEKTDFSKEKKQGLHGWFARQGGKGKSKGWVDCNTCRDGKCKSCGRKEGESRSKYPACRPTPSACKTKGRGKSWGKKSTNEEFPIQSLYREKENMEIKKKDIFDEDLVLKRDQSKKAIYVQSDLDSDKARSQETFKNKEALKSAGFKWDGDIKSWKTDDVNFMLAKKTIETINKKEFLIDTLEQLEEIIASSENTPEKEGLMGKIDMYINDLSNATDEAAMSAEIRRYLTFFSKFKGHSLFNTWLIYIQSGGKATKVAGFRQWETKFYRRVKKGAKGLQIFVPIFTKSTSKDDETGEEITKENAVRFKPGYVYDISQTEPIDERGEVPEEPNWFADLEPTERSIELYKYFIELCEDMGIQISKSDSERGEKGYSAGNKINISSAKEGAGEVSTLVHEIAHELMHWKKSSIYYQENTNRELEELQAESVSYVVLKHYELPTEHHPTYLALWKANKEKIKDNVKVITDVAKFIITEIDKIEKRNQKNEVINEQTKQDIEKELKLNEIKNLFKRLLK